MEKFVRQFPLHPSLSAPLTLPSNLVGLLFRLMVRALKYKVLCKKTAGKKNDTVMVMISSYTQNQAVFIKHTP